MLLLLYYQQYTPQKKSIINNILNTFLSYFFVLYLKINTSICKFKIVKCKINLIVRALLILVYNSLHMKKYILKKSQL